MTSSDIDTPALVIDLDAMERNLARMAAFARERGLRLRPHAKMHKSAELARLQMAAGAVGVCVQKTAEAERLAEGGVSDLYISNVVAAPRKLARVWRLARSLRERHGEAGRLALATDSTAALENLIACADPDTGTGTTLDVFIEIDVGQGRCGLPPGEAAVALARRLHAPQVRALGLRFAGLQAYHGRAQHVRDPAERAQAIAAAAQAVRETVAALEAAGMTVPLVTGAGSGSFTLEADSGCWGELQAGSYLFMDADYAANLPQPGAPRFEHALFVKSEVISRSATHAVCDAGHKSHAIDSGLPLVHPLAGQPDWEFANGGDEHGILRAPAGQRLPEIGETVWLIPGHCDPTVNLHDTLVGVRGGLAQGRVERLIRVDARGALT